MAGHKASFQAVGGGKAYGEYLKAKINEEKPGGYEWAFG